VSDWIVLRGVRARGRHGVLAKERERGQDFIVDVELSVDVRSAAASDDVADTVDYGALGEQVASLIEGEPVDLLETLASRIAARCLAASGPFAAIVTVHKPQAPLTVEFADVEVRVRRDRLVLALGSNLGDREAHLRGGLEVIAGHVPVLAVSPVYETAPVGGPPQEDYLNAVVVTAAPPTLDVLRLCGEAEAARGRTRAVPWGPRTLDVDVVSFGDRISDEPRLTLPHPRAHERAFVLVPWWQIDPHAYLPGWGPIASLPAVRERSGVRRKDDVRLATGGVAGAVDGRPR
jgi:dihydroneopterin aldolase/2-amino-4-hydroxy-6-hydroxymethyldihydropteridine diphosphokinase